MKIKVSPLTVLMFGIVAVVGDMRLYVMAYMIMGLHEFAHFLASVCIGLKAESITFSPFGVHLQLKTKIINSISEEIILYSVGPLINALAALFALFFNMYEFYRLNIALFLINILPIVPLDGGMILVSLMSIKLGRWRSKQFLNILSVIIGLSLLSFSVYCMVNGIMNISLFIISILFIGNVLTSKEMYNSDLISGLSLQKKHSNKAKILITSDDLPITDVIKQISPSYTTIVVNIDKNGKINEIMTEKEIICENSVNLY